MDCKIEILKQQLENKIAENTTILSTRKMNGRKMTVHGLSILSGVTQGLEQALAMLKRIE